MKKLNYNFYKCFVLMILILAQSCKEENLENFANQKGISASVSVKGLSGQIKKDAENLRIPIEVQLSGSATQAFDAHIVLDENAVVSAIANNLLANTLAVADGSVIIPQTVAIPFGSTSVIFEAIMSVSALEKFYFSGKKLAFAVKLTEVAKGNTIEQKKNVAIVSIDPLKIIATNEMHAVSITNGGGSKLEVSGMSNYTPSVATIGIPLGISLSGKAALSFKVDVAINKDTIAVLKSKGVLPLNAVVMQTGEFELPAQVTVDQIANTGKLEVTIPSQTLLKYRNDKIALVVQLTGSSRHVVHPVNRTVVLLIDPGSIIIANNYAGWLPLRNKSPFISLDKKINS